MKDALIFVAAGAAYLLTLGAIVAWLAVLPSIGLLWVLGWLA